MSLFNLPVVHEEKEVSQHPWEKTVKDLNSHKIKYAHNSVHNPPYPKKKEKQRAPEKDRVKFTVIGNRVTKEFIYCAKMVQGMHKYRSKIYDPPVVKGVTSIEWPSVLNNLKVEYGGLAYCLSSQVAVLRNNKFIGGEKELRELIESEYIYHLTIDYHKESVNQFASFVKASGRSFAYMHIKIDSKLIGTFIFMLYTDIVPKTCENFLRLCKTRKGGYSGTPVHRIVKDGWIQCGGFGLKSVDMDCENFIVPHDRRGVLAMANDGRHVDCSTQFFVLLQPAPWMQSKYVAFGQLVDGESTLKAIEEIPTWYESPRAEIIIYRAGILNMDCQDIMINPGAVAYIDGHIDDLVTIGEIFYEALMEQVFLEIEFRRIARMEQKGEEEEEEKHKADDDKHKEDIRATQRFMRRKDEIQNQLRKLHGVHRDSKRASSTHSKAPSEKSNKEFDVDVYEFEPEAEEYIYPQSPVPSVSEPPREKRPFYIPLTDVPYPEEVSSEYDLKKFLKGDYCLESDLAPTDGNRKVILAEKKWSYNSDIFNFFSGDDDDIMQRDDLDSDEEEEIKQYLKENADRVSFAGAVIKEVAKGVGMVNLFEDHRKSELITDEVLRRFRIASMDTRTADDKRVSISVPLWEKGTTTKIKRRQTGFVRPEDLAKIRKFARDEFDDEEEETESPFSNTDRKVSVSINMPEEASEKHDKIKRRQTGFVRPQDLAKIRLFSKGNDDDEDDEDDEEPDTNERQADDTPKWRPAPTGTEGEKKEMARAEDNDPEQQQPVDSNCTRSICAEEEIVQKPQMTEIKESEASDDESEDNVPAPDLGATRSTATSTVSIREPFGSKEVHDKIKRRQTGFVKPEELEHIREFVKDSMHYDMDENDEDDEDDEEIGPVPQLSGTRSKTTSTVSINVPMDAEKMHEKIKRRQTGFVKPEELAQIREFVKNQDIDTGYDFEDDENVKKTEVKLPEDAEEKYNKVKRRPTSFVKSGALAKIRASQGDDEEESNYAEEQEVKKDLDSEDEDDEEPFPEIIGTRSKTTSTVSINVPIDSKEIHARIKRRQTGFVKAEELAQIREFVRDQDIDTGYNLEKEEKAKKTEVKLPEDAEEKYNKVKRRPTSFVKSDALSKIRALEGNLESNLGEYEDEEEREPVPELSGLKSKTASTVSINVPFNSKEERDKKIKRRQTGFVKPEELAQIREFVKDLEEGEKEKKTGVKLPEDAEEKYNKVKRRQTGFVKPGVLAKIRELRGEGEEEMEGEEVKNEQQKNRQYEDEDEEPVPELSGTKSKTTSTVSITVPFGSKEVHDKIKRRQTGFVKPEELAKIREFVKDQDIDTGTELEENEEEKKAGVKLPDDAEEKYNKVKRRQTGFVKPSALAHIRELQGDDEEIEEEVNTDQDSKRDEHEDDKDTIPELSGTKSKTTSTVSINIPFGSKEEHDRIHRRQTAFVKPEELAQIREFVKGEEFDTEYDFVDKTEVDVPDDVKVSYKLRQTSFAKPEALSKIREFSKDDITEEEDGERDLGQTRKVAPSAVVISEPEGAKTTHEKIKRRQTGFVSPDMLTKIREFATDLDEEESEDEKAIVIHEPDGAKQVHEKIKRRQTGFVKPQEAAKLRGEVDDDDDYLDDALAEQDSKEPSTEPPIFDEESKKARKARQTSFVKDNELNKVREFVKDEQIDDEVDLRATRSQGPSVVCINEPEGADKVHEKIKRRQTGFVSPDQLTKIREFARDEIDEDEEDEYKAGNKGAIVISEPEGAKTTHDKIKRRQTGYVKPEEAAKLRAMAEDEEVNEDEDKNNVKNKTKDRRGLVEIREPDGSKEKSEKIKRRQTGFFKPQDLILEEDDCDKENNPDINNRKVSVSIAAPENTDKQSHIKRRQTGFVRPQDVAKLIEMADDDDEDDEGDDDDGDARKSSDSKETISISNNKKESDTAEYSEEVTACALFVTFKGRNQSEYKKHRKVRIAPPRSNGGTSSPNKKIVNPPERVESETEMRKSLLARLYDEVKKDDDVLPTLKDYRPMSESQQQKNIMLTFSQNQLSVEPDARNDKYFRPSLTVEESFEQVLNLQHGKKVTRKISTDYVNTIDQIERRPENSIRSMEYAKTRPAMTVAEYQKKNRLYQEERKRSNDRK